MTLPKVPDGPAPGAALKPTAAPERTTTKVTVTAPGGAQVTIEAAEPMPMVAAEAAHLLERATKLGEGRPGPAVGFAAERRYTPPAAPSGMWRAPGPYPTQAGEQ